MGSIMDNKRQYYIDRQHYIDIAKDTYNNYLSELTPATEYYPPSYVFPLADRSQNESPEQIVVDQTANQVLESLKEEDGKTALLNFASATSVGGGWLSGARAQEETLCRSSNLWLSLYSCPEFYRAGKDSVKYRKTRPKDPIDLYTDAIIYTKNVEFCKDDLGKYLKDPVKVDVITCACPKINDNFCSDYPYSVYYNRMRKIIQSAEMHGVKTLILGAWGCGAFGNDPVFIKKVINEALKGSTIKKVIHPIPSAMNNNSNYNYEAFLKN